MEEHFDTGAWFLTEETIKSILLEAKIKFNKEVLRHAISNLEVVNILNEHLDSSDKKIYEVNLTRLSEFMPKIISGLREDEQRNGYFTLKDVYKHIDTALGWNKEEISVNAEFLFKGILDSLYFIFNIIVQTEKGYKFTDFSSASLTDFKSYSEDTNTRVPSPFENH